MAEFTDRSITDLIRDRMQSIKRTEPCPKDLTDEESALDQVSEEATAAMKYKVAARHAEDPHTKAVFESNADEELVHIGEDEQVAEKQNKRVRKKIDEGREEAEEIGDSVKRAIGGHRNKYPDGPEGNRRLGTGDPNLADKSDYDQKVQHEIDSEENDLKYGGRPGGHLSQSPWVIGSRRNVFTPENLRGNGAGVGGNYTHMLSDDWQHGDDQSTLPEGAMPRVMYGQRVLNDDGTPSLPTFTDVDMSGRDYGQEGVMYDDIKEVVQQYMSAVVGKQGDPGAVDSAKKALMSSLFDISQRYEQGEYGTQSPNVMGPSTVPAEYAKELPEGYKRSRLPYQLNEFKKNRYSTTNGRRGKDETADVKKANDEAEESYWNSPDAALNMNYYVPNMRSMGAYYDVLQTILDSSNDLGLTRFNDDNRLEDRKQAAGLSDLLRKERDNTLKQGNKARSTYDVDRAYKLMQKGIKDGKAPDFLGNVKRRPFVNKNPSQEKWLNEVDSKGAREGSTDADKVRQRIVARLRSKIIPDAKSAIDGPLQNTNYWRSVGGVDENALIEYRDMWNKMLNGRRPSGTFDLTENAIPGRLMTRAKLPAVKDMTESGALSTLIYLANQADKENFPLKKGEAISNDSFITPVSEETIDDLTMEYINAWLSNHGKTEAELDDDDMQDLIAMSRDQALEELEGDESGIGDLAERLKSTLRGTESYAKDPQYARMVDELLSAATTGALLNDDQRLANSTDNNVWNMPIYKDTQKAMTDFTTPEGETLAPYTKEDAEKKVWSKAAQESVDNDYIEAMKEDEDWQKEKDSADFSEWRENALDYAMDAYKWNPKKMRETLGLSPASEYGSNNTRLFQLTKDIEDAGPSTFLSDEERAKLAEYQNREDNGWEVKARPEVTPELEKAVDTRKIYDPKTGATKDIGTHKLIHPEMLTHDQAKAYREAYDAAVADEQDFKDYVSLTGRAMNQDRYKDNAGLMDDAKHLFNYDESTGKWTPKTAEEGYNGVDMPLDEVNMFGPSLLKKDANGQFIAPKLNESAFEPNDVKNNRDIMQAKAEYDVASKHLPTGGVNATDFLTAARRLEKAYKTNYNNFVPDDAKKSLQAKIDEVTMDGYKSNRDLTKGMTAGEARATRKAQPKDSIFSIIGSGIGGKRYSNLWNDTRDTLIGINPHNDYTNADFETMMSVDNDDYDPLDPKSKPTRRMNMDELKDFSRSLSETAKGVHEGKLNFDDVNPLTTRKQSIKDMIQARQKPSM